MKHTGLLTICALSVLLATAACTTTTSAPVPAQISTTKISPVMVRAAKIVVVDAYHAPMGAPNVEHLFKVTPAQAARDVVAKQLQPNGAPYILTVKIDDASVVRKPLATKDTLFARFSPEPSEQFNGRVALSFELAEETAPDIVMGRASVVATREKTLLNNASLAERDAAFFEMTQTMADDLAQGMSTTVPNTFGQ